MRIGELAQRTGTTPKAIRLYEARGLLGTVVREGSYRHYGEGDVARVQLIRQAQGLGFSLAQLEGLPELHQSAGWVRMAALLAERREAVAREMARLAALDGQLAALQAELLACDAFAAPAVPPACAAPQGLLGPLRQLTPLASAIA
ncbi:MAG: MerR family transcriptional regulator [Acidovorax sp.]